MRWIALLVALVATSACEDLRGLIDSEEIEQQLREDPSRPAKVGALVGVSIYQSAVKTAKYVRAAPDPRCHLRVGSGERWTSELVIERRRGTEVVASWKETRRLSIATGGVELTSSADYRTRIGMEGRRERAWRVVGDDVWLSTEAPEGPLWYRRAPADDERERIETTALGSFQALLDAVDGWSPDAAGWTLGDAELRCVSRGEGLAFIDRFVARADATKARLTVDDVGRRLVATWILDDQSTLSVDYRDRIDSMDEAIGPPPKEQVVPIERDRSLARARKLADDLAEEGFVELTKPAPPPEKPTPKKTP